MALRRGTAKGRDVTVIMEEVWKACSEDVEMIAARDKQK